MSALEKNETWEKEVKTKKGPEHKKVVDNLESLEEKIKTIKGIERHQVRRDLLLLRQLPHKPQICISIMEEGEVLLISARLLWGNVFLRR